MVFSFLGHGTVHGMTDQVGPQVVSDIVLKGGKRGRHEAADERHVRSKPETPPHGASQGRAVSPTKLHAALQVAYIILANSKVVELKTEIRELKREIADTKAASKQADLAQTALNMIGLDAMDELDKQLKYTMEEAICEKAKAQSQQVKSNKVSSPSSLIK